jgi:protocatechuate 3,4-dioxygenase alpha subunit
MLPAPSQTIGPFFADAMSWLGPGHGDVVIRGTVFDGDGAPVSDATIEAWHGGPDGDFEPGSFSRAITDDGGGYVLLTARPGSVDDVQAPHMDVSIFARGLLQRLVTRIYLADAAGAGDPVLAGLEPGRRATLVAQPDGDDGARYRFDIHLQGDRETVFFAW